MITIIIGEVQLSNALFSSNILNFVRSVDTVLTFYGKLWATNNPESVLPEEILNIHIAVKAMIVHLSETCLRDDEDFGAELTTGRMGIEGKVVNFDVIRVTMPGGTMEIIAEVSERAGMDSCHAMSVGFGLLRAAVESHEAGRRIVDVDSTGVPFRELLLFKSEEGSELKHKPIQSPKTYNC